eukprot:TRINITY_DN1425_c0_g2_i1.p1 TRINITY_DN1425_c0_g2~~TRINITY_DN1425_c0_g2_i1.p1  ORF type:complete len:358 (+),score=55.98 TRINITY_DN1425_c0_g2_i1:96-1076(+)
METADESEQPMLMPHDNNWTRSAALKLTGGVLAMCTCGILAVHTIFFKAPESTHTQAFTQLDSSGCFKSHGRASCCKVDKNDRSFHGRGKASIFDGISEKDCACKCAESKWCKAYEFNHLYWRCELHIETIKNFTCGSQAGQVEKPHSFECNVKEVETCNAEDVCPKHAHKAGSLWGEETEKASCKQYRVASAPEPQYPTSCRGKWKRGGRTGVNGFFAAHYSPTKKKINMKLSKLAKALPIACSDCPTWDCSGAYIGDKCWTQAGLAGNQHGHWICCPGNFGANSGDLFENVNGSCMTWQPGNSLEDCPALEEGSDCDSRCSLKS